MTDQEKLKEKEEKNAQALNELYDEETIQKSNQMFERMSEEELEELQEKAKNILVLLKIAHETGNPESEQSHELAVKHREWLGYTWPEYSKELHRGLADLYATDEGLIVYYEDAAGKGAADFFRQAIWAYTVKDA